MFVLVWLGLGFPGLPEEGNNMERLTERSRNGCAVYRHPTPEPDGWKENRHAVLERCCQYEDTGLTPEEIRMVKCWLAECRCWSRVTKNLNFRRKKCDECLKNL